MRKIAAFLFIAFLLAATGCSDRAGLIARPSEDLTVTAVPATSTVTVTPSPTLTPSLTPTPTHTPFPTNTPTPSLTPTPTLIPNPMQIAAMRQSSYPGSDIVVEKELEKGANYRRYYAWYRSEGLKIYGLLTIPDAKMPVGGFPALVFIHGSIEPTIYRTLERYEAYTDFLARSGYVVYKIDLRGHDRSEGTPDNAYSLPGYNIDVLNAVSSLQRHPQVNPEKIGMWGHSMGGYLTLRAMVISKQIKVGVIWAGLVCSYPDMIYRWHASPFTPTPSSASRGWRGEWIARYGTPQENPAFWDSVSATSYLADLSGPLQLHHGTGDTSVPYQFSEELAASIQKAGGKAELYTYPADNHNLSVSFVTAMTRTVKFFDAVLK